MQYNRVVFAVVAKDKLPEIIVKELVDMHNAPDVVASLFNDIMGVSAKGKCPLL